MARNPRSKTLVTWLAVVGGALGLHRLYLHGWSDRWAWVHLPPALAGLVGVIRMRELGQDDRWAWLLTPLLGLAISAGMLAAIVHALTTDERWQQRWHPDQPVVPTGWAPVLGAITALLLGGGVLIGTIAFAGQRYFEWSAS
ncbi:MAG: hypothetical protein ACKVQR_08675 [Aquabacterium sp.]